MARYALVIGIADYKNPLQRLPKTTTDAEAVVQVLKKYGDFQQVIRLPLRWNQEKQDYEIAPKAVTGTELGQALRKFLLEQAAGDDALIYFTGHGIKVSDNLGQEKGYLATSDCAIQTEGNKIIAQQNGISLDSFNELIRASHLRSLVLLLDCCHSGYFLERQLVEQSLTVISSQRDYYLITACRSFEQAIAFDFEQHDVFTGALIEGLSVENAGEDGQISGDRLFDYISSTLKGSKQEPIRMGWGRSITLVTYPQEEITIEKVTFNTENPYRGLYPFESEQEKYFCGREQAVRALLDRLSSNRFLSVIGPSGCGKSSLVKAGLLPHLERDRLPGSSQWGIETFAPGKHPLGKLIEILDRQHRQNQPFVLFIDQMEEIFTLCEDDAERQFFIRLMANEATNSDRLTRVIIAIRTDFLDRCAAYPEVANLINRTQPTTYMVTPLSRQELEEAIKEPAALHGVKFQGGLISQIADDVDDQPGALPLLQYALKELWRVCIENPDSPEPRLTGKGYKEIGGVKGALENRANLLYQSFSSPDQLFVRRMFMELVQLGEENTVTRRRASRERLEADADSIEQLRRVVGLLANQRLIVTDEDTVEVAHEALLTEWTLLRGWIEENRENIRLSRLLEAECREWQERFKKSDEALLSGAKLAAILEWKENIQPKLPVEEAEFLQRSLARRDREMQKELEQERQLREAAEARAKAEAQKAEQESFAALAKIETALEAEARAKAEAREAEAKTKVAKQRTRFAIVVGGLVTFTLGLAVVAQQLETHRKLEQARVIGAFVSKAQILFDRDDQLEALIASVEALNKIKEAGGNQNTSLNLLQPIIYGVQERNRLSGHTGIVFRLSFSQNGEIIASASADGTVRFWKKDGEPLDNPIKINGGYVTGVSFAPVNSNIIASASDDGSVRLWNLNGTPIKNLTPKHKRGAWRVNFSPDGKLIASAGSDGTIHLWNLNGDLLEKIPVSNRGVEGVSINRNNQIIAAATKDGMIKLWDIENRKFLNQFKGDSKAVYDIAFSPNGERFVSGGRDKLVKMWTKEGKFIRKFEGHKASVYSVTFNKEGTRIASSSLDDIVIIWNVNGSIIKKFKCTGGYDVKFSTEQERIGCTAGEKILVWNIMNNPHKNSVPDDLLVYSCQKLDEYLKHKENICGTINVKK